MKAPTIAILAASLLAASGLAVRAQQPEEVRAALRLAGADIQSALAASTLPKDKPLAILPVRGDSNGYILGILKTAITGAGLLCVEGKGDPFFDEVLKEVAWDERKEDMLDTNTIVKFGQLKAAKLLAYAFIREAWAGKAADSSNSSSMSAPSKPNSTSGAATSRGVSTTPNSPSARSTSTPRCAGFCARPSSACRPNSGPPPSSAMSTVSSSCPWPATSTAS